MIQVYWMTHLQATIGGSQVHQVIRLIPEAIRRLATALMQLPMTNGTLPHILISQIATGRERYLLLCNLMS